MSYSDAFEEVERKYGLPPGYLARVAQIESSNNPNAKNPKSSAGGLFQFIDSTAKQYGLENKFDPIASTDAAGRLASDNAAALRSKLGREPTAGELYLAHQQGAGGAIKMLSNPGAAVGGDAIALNGGRPGMTGGDFANKWTSKFDGTSTQGGPPMNPMMPSRMPEQESQQGGLLAGLFNDPGKLAALQLLMSGINPFSKGNEMAPFIQAAQLRDSQKYNRQKDERDFGLREREFGQRQSNTDVDNRRADEHLKVAQETARRQGISPAVQAATDMGLKVGDPGYQEFITSFYKKKTDSVEDQVAAREKVAERLGLKSGSPQYQSYVATGKLGRDEPLSVSDRKAIASAEDELPNLEQTVGILKRAGELNDKTFTGYTAGIRGQIGSKMPGAGYLIDEGAAKDTLEFENIMSTEAVTTMAETLKGATTDFELKEFKARLSDPSTPPEIRKRIIERMKTLAERQLKIKTDRMNQLREGEYYKPGGGASTKSEKPTSGGKTSGGVSWKVVE